MGVYVYGIQVAADVNTMGVNTINLQGILIWSDIFNVLPLEVVYMCINTRLLRFFRSLDGFAYNTKFLVFFLNWGFTHLLILLTDSIKCVNLITWLIWLNLSENLPNWDISNFLKRYHLQRKKMETFSVFGSCSG